MKKEKEIDIQLTKEDFTKCPKCWADLLDTSNKLKQRIVNEYGRIPKSEFMDLVEASREAIQATDSLQQKYEIGLEKEGIFEIGFKAECRSCGFYFLYEHKELANLYD